MLNWNHSSSTADKLDAPYVDGNSDYDDAADTVPAVGGSSNAVEQSAD